MRLSERFEEALTYATRKHATQVRKSTEVPYVEQLLAVASIALTHGADEDEAIAAPLPDAVEDQGGVKTLNEIRSSFGDRVTDIMEGCSRYGRDAEASVEEAKRGVHRPSPQGVAISGSARRPTSSTTHVRSLQTIASPERASGAGSKAGRGNHFWYYRMLVETYRVFGTDAACSRTQ
jgi:hypothetical protein